MHGSVVTIGCQYLAGAAMVTARKIWLSARRNLDLMFSCSSISDCPKVGSELSVSYMKIFL